MVHFFMVLMKTSVDSDQLATQFSAEGIEFSKSNVICALIRSNTLFIKHLGSR